MTSPLREPQEFVSAFMQNAHNNNASECLFAPHEAARVVSHCVCVNEERKRQTEGLKEYETFALLQ